MTFLNETKIELDGLRIFSFQSVTIERSNDSKAANCSIVCEFLDSETIERFKTGTEVRVSSRRRQSGDPFGMDFLGVVVETPKALDKIRRTFEITATDYLGKTKNVLINEAYENVPIHEIFINLASHAPFLNLGTIEPTDYTLTIPFKNEHLYDCFDKIASAVDYTYYVDNEKRIHFVKRASITSPHVIREGEYKRGTSKFAFDQSRLVNSLRVEGGKALSSDQVHVLFGDGVNEVYSLPYSPVATSRGNVEVIKNGIALRVGADNLNQFEDGFDCLVNAPERLVKFPLPLLESDRVEVRFRYRYDIGTYLENRASIEAYGLHQDVLRKHNITNKESLRNAGQLHLDKYSKPLITGGITVFNDKWNLEIAHVQIEELGVDDYLEITSKSIKLKPKTKEIDLKFEQKPMMTNVVKDILQRIKELEDFNENDGPVEKYDSIHDTVSIKDQVALRSESGFFVVGISEMGDVV